MSSGKRSSGTQKESKGAVESKSQLLLALKNQVVQLQQQLREEQEEREKISSWLANTLKPRLKSQFDLHREDIDTHSAQIQKISSFLRDRQGSFGSDSVTREEFEELKTSIAIEREARQQLSLWLKLNFGKNLELLDTRISSRLSGTPTISKNSSQVTVLPENTDEWLRMIGYERYLSEFKRANCSDIRKLVKLTDEHLIKIGIALKRHRGDLIHEIDQLKQKLDAAKNHGEVQELLSTPKRNRTPVSSDIEDIDPFSDSSIESKATEKIMEQNKVLEAEKRRMKEQFDMEKKLWMEQERERLRLQIEKEEKERIQREEEKFQRKLAEERRELEVKQQEIERKEREAERLRKEQRENERRERELSKKKQQEQNDEEERLQSLAEKRAAKEREIEQRRIEREKREAEERERKADEALRLVEEKKKKEEEDRRREEEERQAAKSKTIESPKIEKKISTTVKTDNEDILTGKASVATLEEPKKVSSTVKSKSSSDNDSGKPFESYIEDIRNDECGVNWVAFYFDKGSNSIKLTGYGDGGHDELLSVLEDDKVQYAMLRVVDHKRRVKFIYIHWVGSKAHAFLKARSGTKKAEMLKLMGQYHLEIPAETKDEISKQVILTKLKAAVNF